MATPSRASFRGADRKAVAAVTILAGAWFAVHAVFAQTALVITTAPAASGLTQDSAVIRWSTSEASTTVVRFGISAAMGDTQRKVAIVPGAPEEDAYEINHSLTLAELQPSTTYFYQAESATQDGRVATSAQATFTTAAASAPLTGVSMTSPSAGATVAIPVELRATTNGPAASADFTVKMLTGVQVTKIGGADAGNGENWDFGGLKLAAGTYVVTATAAGTDAAGMAVTVESAAVTFSVPRDCTVDDWSCGEWGQCTTAGAQTRACALPGTCRDPGLENPATSRSCTPPCTKDAWECGAWDACAAGGTQARTCALKTDCPSVETPKPPESQKCVPACAEDVYSCTDWGTCVVQKVATSFAMSRACTRTTDCPGVDTPKPAETQACNPAATCPKDIWRCADWSECGRDGTQARSCALEKDCPGADTPKPAESQQCAPASVNEPADVNAPASSPVASEDVLAVMGAGDQAKTLSDECAKAGILPERCASWLKAKYADKSCAAAGIFNYASCEKRLTDANGGTFPGCEGKTPGECAAIKARVMLGYMPDDTKKKVDDAVASGAPADALAALGPSAGLVLALRPAKKDGSVWWPAVVGENGETSSNMIVFDADKDGLLDDLERRLGTDPSIPDVAGDGGAGGKVSRDILKTFFEKGDTPSEFVVVDTNGDGTPDTLVDDRKLLGLKIYDPGKAYLLGDTASYSGAFGPDPKVVPESFFAKGDKPTEQQFGTMIDSRMITVDVDGDGKPEGKVSRDILKSFFEKGDTPTRADFNIVDFAFITGAPLEQPLATGVVDAGLTIDLEAPPDGAARPSSGGRENVNDVNSVPVINDAGPLGMPTRDVNDPSAIQGRAAAEGDRAKKGLVVKGRAAPHAIVVIYVYSYVPMVLTTTADENGQYTYDLSDDVGDGEHTAYVALTDDTGKIAMKSSPLSFFVKEARAVTQDEFAKPDVVVLTEPIAQAQRWYLFGAAGAILAGLGVVWFVVARRMKETPPAPPAPPAA